MYPFTLYARPCVTVPSLWISCSAVFTIPVPFLSLYRSFLSLLVDSLSCSTLQVWVPQLRPVLWPAPSSSGPPVLTLEAAVQPSAEMGVGRSQEFYSVTKPSCWRRQWHPTPVLLPGKSHGQRSLEGCSPWGC